MTVSSASLNGHSPNRLSESENEQPARALRNLMKLIRFKLKQNGQRFLQARSEVTIQELGEPVLIVQDGIVVER